MTIDEWPDLVSRRQVAETLGVSEPALCMMAKRGKGPRFLRLGRTIRYRRDDVVAWLAARTVDPATPPASDPGQPWW